MIVSFEGAPATGKTTICTHLAEDGAVRVPEVNALFERPAAESATWYLERQLDRWARAAHESQRGRLALLDGDVLQPVWFAWMYPERCDANWRANLAFFREHRHALGAPDRHVVVRVPEAERRRRELARSAARGHDRARAMGKVARYETMADALRRYFDGLAKALPELVHFVDADTLDAAVTAARSASRGSVPVTALLDAAETWLERNPLHPRPAVR